MDNPIRYAVITSSDSVARNDRPDAGGDAVVNALAALDAECVDRAVCPDDVGALSRQLRAFTDRADVQLVLTTGGTGLGPRDVTPEATKRVVDYEVPGISETIRAETLSKTRMAMLSRGIAGVRNRTLVINLPGNPKGVAECLDVVKSVLPHALDLLVGADRGKHPLADS